MKENNTSKSTAPGQSAFLAFITFIILIGGSPVAIRIIFKEMDPFYLGFIRYGLGAVVFWAVAFFKRLPIPRGRALLGAVLYGILGFGVSFLFLSWGFVKTSASLGAILMALMPLMTIFLSSFQGLESLTARGITGSLLSVIGIAVTVDGASSSKLSIPHIAALIIGTAFLAESTVVAKRFPRNHPVITNAVAMTVGSVILGAASLLSGEAWLIPSLPASWIALLYQIIPVTILAFFLYAWVLNQWTASSISYSFVIIPLVTVVIAAGLVGEHITQEFLIGTSLVLLGVIVGVLLPGGKKKASSKNRVEDCVAC